MPKNASIRRLNREADTLIPVVRFTKRLAIKRFDAIDSATPTAGPIRWANRRSKYQSRWSD
jgi:hypothetical protein